MREIKFRLWCKDLEEMTEIEKMGFENNQLWYIGCIDHDKEETYFPENEDHVLMQYTGLKDKNGKEIYEGDVVENSRCGSNQLMVVKWSDALEEVSSDGVEWTRQKPGFVFEKIGKGMMYVFIARKDLEVIGNIYENPELLGDSQ